jgi:hypothetical protein
MPTNAKRLAGRSADDYVRLWKLGFGSQRYFLAITFKISPVSFTRISVLLEAERFKSLSLEAQSQSATAGKQIQHTDFSFWFWAKQRIDSINEIHFVILILPGNLVEHDLDVMAGRAVAGFSKTVLLETFFAMGEG